MRERERERREGRERGERRGERDREGGGIQHLDVHQKQHM